MKLIKGVGNCEIVAWTIGCIVACHVVAVPFTYLLELDIDWRVSKGGNYADYEKLIEKQNVFLKRDFTELHRRVVVQGGEETPFVLPHFNPEVYCPFLVAAGGRKLCAPWLFEEHLVPNRIDVEAWKEKKTRVVINEIHKKDGEKREVEGSATCAYSLHPGAHSADDDAWRAAIPGCKHDTEDGTALPGQKVHVLYAGVFEGQRFEPSTAKGASVCQLVVDMKANETDTVRDLRIYGQLGYRIMNYERIAAPSPTARFSFIQSNCTDHFGAKYIKKYLV